MFLWRMSLWGLAFGAALGSFYGWVVGFLLPPGFFLGAFLGGIMGLYVGAASGAALHLLVRVLRSLYGCPIGRGRAFFRRVGGMVCALASVVALLFFLILPPQDDRGYFDGGTIDIAVFIVGPTILASLSMWFFGRIGSRGFRSRFGETKARSGLKFL